MSSMFSLEGKVAIVTGASRWTGKVIALEMARAGVDLVISARTPKPLEEAAAEVRGLGRRCLAVPTDVGDAAQVDHLIQKAMEEYGRIDILVSNAGTPMGGSVPTLDLKQEAWDSDIRLNLTGHFLCSKAVAPIMVRQGGGSIVAIASTAGLRVSPDAAGYTAAKAGLMHLVRKLAAEWGAVPHPGERRGPRDHRHPHIPGLPGAHAGGEGRLREDPLEGRGEDGAHRGGGHLPGL